jgi:branched-chain amino acid transport system permease protein
LPLFVQILLFGLANGSIYALIALGYTMVFGIIELINFAHGDIFTLSTLVSLPLLGLTALSGGVSGIFGIVKLLVVAILTILIIGGLNVAIERFAYRPLRNAPRMAPLLTTLGMSFMLEGAMYMVIGPFNIRYPDLLPPQRIHLPAGITIGVRDLVVVAVAVFLMVLLNLFINRTKAGKAIRATAQDRTGAQLMGINIDYMISLTFFVGAAVAAAGAIVYGAYYNAVYFNMGFWLGLIAFTAAVLGGIGNITGAAVGGIIIGLVRAISDVYLSSTWTDALIFSILIAILVVRPNGLLGMRVPEK